MRVTKCAHSEMLGGDNSETHSTKAKREETESVTHSDAGPFFFYKAGISRLKQQRKGCLRENTALVGEKKYLKAAHHLPYLKL